jgi:hypothetical protein
MLRVTFHAGIGESPSRMLAQCLRFCADGTLRGPDNCVVARYVEGFWHVGRSTHRELDCEGPVEVRIRHSAHDDPVHRGPFKRVHTASGILFGNDVSLHVILPGRNADGAAHCQELTLISP